MYETYSILLILILSYVKNISFLCNVLFLKKVDHQYGTVSDDDIQKRKLITKMTFSFYREREEKTGTVLESIKMN